MTESIENNILPEEPVETQALTADQKADIWVRESLQPIDEELLDGVESLRDLPSTYSQARQLRCVLSDLGEQKEADHWMELLNVEIPGGFLFCGEAGCGKRSTAWGMMGDLCRLGYCQMIYLTGAEMNLLSAKKVKQRMKAIYRYSAEGEDNLLVLLLDGISKCRLGNWIMDYISNEDAFVFPIFLENSVDVFNSELRRRFPVISFPLPDRQARLEFLKENMKGELDPNLLPHEQNEDLGYTAKEIEEMPLEQRQALGLFQTNKTAYEIEVEAITQEEIADQTEGFNYQQLKHLTDLMRFELMQMLRENSAMTMTDAANALIAGGRYRIKSYTIRQMIRLLKYQQVPAFMPQISAFTGNSTQTVTHSADTSSYDFASEGQQMIQEVARGGKKDYQLLVKYFKEDVADRFRRSELGPVSQVYINSKESGSDLEEVQNLTSQSSQN